MLKVATILLNLYWSTLGGTLLFFFSYLVLAYSAEPFHDPDGSIGMRHVLYAGVIGLIAFLAIWALCLWLRRKWLRTRSDGLLLEDSTKRAKTAVLVEAICGLLTFFGLLVMIL